MKDAVWPSLNSFLWDVLEGITFLCASVQVPVPSIPANVHESGKSVEKPDAIFSQERDPRFAEMFAGITACKWCLIFHPVLSLVTWCGAQPRENVLHDREISNKVSLQHISRIWGISPKDVKLKG